MSLFDFTSIADLGKFWDGSSQAGNTGGGTFNKFGTGLAGRSHNIDLLYQNLVGRNADPGGRKYWGDKLAAGTDTYASIADALKASAEYTDQQAHLAANPNATGADLRRLKSAYVSPYHTYSGSAVAGWTPGDPLTQAIANAVTTNTTNADGTVNTAANYGDQTQHNVLDVLHDNTLWNASIGPYAGNAAVLAADARNTTEGGLTGITGGVDTKVATDLTTGTYKKIHDQTGSVLGSGAVAKNLAGGTTHTYVPGTTVTTGDGDVFGVAAGGGNTPGGGTQVVKTDGTVVTIDGDGNVVTGTGPAGPSGTGPSGTGPSGPASVDLSGILGKFDDITGLLGNYGTQLADLQQAYSDNQQAQQDMWNAWQWDMNQTKNPQVRGVRTLNELSDFKTGGTKGFFGRGGNMLKTSSLNI